MIISRPSANGIDALLLGNPAVKIAIDRLVEGEVVIDEGRRQVEVVPEAIGSNRRRAWTSVVDREHGDGADHEDRREQHLARNGRGMSSAVRVS